jgi:sporulation protein YlmC with PRC-barrel domain
MDLVRDMLDKRILDRKGVSLGRVDGIVLEVRAGRRPVVAAIESGLPTLARRLHRVLVYFAEALERAAGTSDGSPLRIPCSKVSEVGTDVTVDLEARETGAFAWEDWVRRTVIGRIPGSGK